MPYHEIFQSQISKWGDPTTDHQMRQTIKRSDATVDVVNENPVIDIEVRGAGLSRTRKAGGR